MYLTVINFISYSFNAFVLIYILYKIDFLGHWENAKKHIQKKLKIKDKISKAEKEGKKPFTFSDGVTVYARTQSGAIFQHKELSKKRKK